MKADRPHDAYLPAATTPPAGRREPPHRWLTHRRLDATTTITTLLGPARRQHSNKDKDKDDHDDKPYQ
ncbi:MULTISPECIES: hypothetical protein [unclassified Micromonospora]|uniref:hypothetical protein n=1 Tax=unclassified Micromonospora TaxID=2617518 RepID=UPI001C247B5C|nr:MULTISPECIES: hypothetical protein [unclassified Micromonospora]MBU8857755.1 hypothetical protein [Micromonospora sp. WMMB482]MDM4783382.1 hypothetical protein [Micromonospora sp. b486]